jgi:hypothetical protein
MATKDAWWEQWQNRFVLVDVLGVQGPTGGESSSRPPCSLES